MMFLVDASLHVRDIMPPAEVEKKIKEFMENAKKIQKYLISEGRPDPSTSANPASREEMLRKVICRNSEWNQFEYLLFIKLWKKKIIKITLISSFLLFLEQEIAMLEDELKKKDELILKTEKKYEGWKNELKEQLDKHITELKRV